MQTWFDRVWSQEDVSAIYEMFDQSGAASGLGKRPVNGPVEFEAFQQAMLSQIEDVQISIDKTFEDGDWICAFCTLTAKKKGSDQEVTLPGCTAVRIENDQLMEAYNHWEFMALFEQLGLLPEDSFAQCLGGTPLCE